MVCIYIYIYVGLYGYMYFLCIYTHTHLYLNLYVGICKYAVICNASPARCMAIFSASNFVALTRMVRRRHWKDIGRVNL